MDIFEYSDYRSYINKQLESADKTGGRSRLAKAAGCNPSWMTRALAGEVQLTPDQTFGIAQYFRLNEEESDYLLLLVELERSASSAFKKRIENKLKALAKKANTLSSSVKTDSEVLEIDRAIYYSSWIYAALHVACMIRGYSIEELHQTFHLSNQVIQRTLSDLKKMGLVYDKSGQWFATSKSVHLDTEHPMAQVGHASWRNFTIQKIQACRGNFHYSAIHCLSQKDIEKIQKKLKAMILECRNVIEDSKSEKLAVFCLDWYAVD